MLRARLLACDWGVRVQGVDVLAIAPPRQVAAAFDAVVKAGLESSGAVDQRCPRPRRPHLANEAAGEADASSPAPPPRGETAAWSRVSETATRRHASAPCSARYRRANPAVVGNLLLQDGIRRALATVGTKILRATGAADGEEMRLNCSGRSNPGARRIEAVR